MTKFTRKVYSEVLIEHVYAVRTRFIPLGKFLFPLIFLLQNNISNNITLVKADEEKESTHQQEIEHFLSFVQINNNVSNNVQWQLVHISKKMCRTGRESNLIDSAAKCSSAIWKLILSLKDNRQSNLSYHHFYTANICTMYNVHAIAAIRLDTFVC